MDLKHTKKHKKIALAKTNTKLRNSVLAVFYDIQPESGPIRITTEHGQGCRNGFLKYTFSVYKTFKKPQKS